MAPGSRGRREAVRIPPPELGIELDAEASATAETSCCTRVTDGSTSCRTSRALEGDTHSFATARGESEWPGISGPLLFAGYDALIAMKSAAGRDQDVMDIAALGRARGDM